jgi:hypothetical protein
LDLNHKAQRLFETVYPGLIHKLSSLGPGKFLDDNPPYRIINTSADKESITEFSAAIKYGFDDGMMVRIVDSVLFDCDKGTWFSYHHAYHCGPDHRDVKAYHFRIDLDELHSYHVHLYGTYIKDNDPHIPVSLLEPNVKNITPSQFLDLVARFRSTKRLPLRLKKDKK